MWKVTFLFDMRNSEWISICWIHAEYRDEGNMNAVDPGHNRLCYDLYLVEHLESHRTCLRTPGLARLACRRGSYGNRAGKYYSHQVIQKPFPRCRCIGVLLPPWAVCLDADRRRETGQRIQVKSSLRHSCSKVFSPRLCTATTCTPLHEDDSPR